jgi:Protein of unknown function (DUF1573)
MKQFIFAFGIVALAASTSFAQAKTAAKPSAVAADAKSKGANMKFDQTTIDYGTIVQGGEPLRKFHFTNTGSEPLVIKSAKGSCGCTVPTYPKEPIMPGQKGVIEVRYDTQRLGDFMKTVTLTSNALEETSNLTIKGKVEAQPEGTPVRSGGMLSPQGSSR